MRLKDIEEPHRQLLREVTRRISRRLETEFTKLPGMDGPNIGIQLHEGNHKVVMELPAALLLRAGEDMTAREAIRVRIKTRRDRMMFRLEPISMERRLGGSRRAQYGGAGFGGGPGRGRR